MAGWLSRPAGGGLRGGGICLLLPDEPERVWRNHRGSGRILFMCVRAACGDGECDCRGRTMELILIRHLPTPGNEKGLYIGRTDERISERARQEFLSASVRLSLIHISIWPDSQKRSSGISKRQARESGSRAHRPRSGSGPSQTGGLRI